MKMKVIAKETEIINTFSRPEESACNIDEFIEFLSKEKAEGATEFDIIIGYGKLTFRSLYKRSKQDIIDIEIKSLQDELDILKKREAMVQ